MIFTSLLIEDYSIHFYDYTLTEAKQYWSLGKARFVILYALHTLCANKNILIVLSTVLSMNYSAFWGGGGGGGGGGGQYGLYFRGCRCRLSFQIANDSDVTESSYSVSTLHLMLTIFVQPKCLQTDTVWCYIFVVVDVDYHSKSHMTVMLPNQVNQCQLCTLC